ncbi:MAG: MBL fold metallo-hydrolase [Saprospiraceae bacterium]
MKLTITGFSTALFSTWYFIEELGLLFDCGDGASSGLLQKARKVKHLFISHADRDHLTGLLQFNQLNARQGFPKIYFPRDSNSFPFLKEFSTQFDPHVSGTEWIKMEEGNIFEIKKNIFVQPFRNEHVPVGKELVKSLSFHVFETKRKLKEEYLNLSGKEIAALRKELGEENITIQIRNNILSYSGDTPIENDGRWDHTKVLIHEATFLRKGDVDLDDRRQGKHSYLEEVIEMVAKTKVEQLILGHFSSRYSVVEIDEAIDFFCKKFGLKIPVYRILPGEIVRDILH